MHVLDKPVFIVELFNSRLVCNNLPNPLANFFPGWGQIPKALFQFLVKVIDDLGGRKKRFSHFVGDINFKEIFERLYQQGANAIASSTRSKPMISSSDARAVPSSLLF